MQGELLSADERTFIRDTLPQITGWLMDEAAYFTAYILNHQTMSSIRGPALEFGVYHGRFLCLLLNQARRQNETVLGYDIFEHSHIDTPRRHAREIFGT